MSSDSAIERQCERGGLMADSKKSNASSALDHKNVFNEISNLGVSATGAFMAWGLRQR
jgi:hypothetical protein